MRREGTKDRAHNRIIRPPRLHENDHILLPRRLSQRAREWVFGQPSADDPGFQSGGYVFLQGYVHGVQGFLFAEGTCFWEDGGDCGGGFFDVFFEEMAQAVDECGVGW